MPNETLAVAQEEEPMTQTAQIFVSHSHNDEQWCSAFAKTLKQAGGDVWYYPKAGELFMRDIESELRARPIFVVIVSPDSMRSPWVKREVNAAISLQDRQPERIILPVVAQKCDIPRLWDRYKRISGPDDTGMLPDEAAKQVAHALALTTEATTRVIRPRESGSSEELVERGAALRARGLLREALVVYDDALAIDETYAAAWTGKGNALQALGMPAQALVAFDRALALDVRDATAWVGKANALQALDHREEDALRAFERALDLSPDLITAWTGKATLLERLGRADEARKAFGKGEEVTFDRTLALNFRPALVWNGKGNALQALNQLTEALDAYQQALALEPDLVPAWVGKGNVLNELQRFDEALDAYQQAHAIDPQDATALAALNFPLHVKRQADPAASSAGYTRHHS